ncbi:MAG: hypothetical protein ACXW0F_06535 [Gaiellaceae bacterium]
MRKRSVPVLLPTFLVLGLLGTWAGTSMGQLPPPPPVTLPTVTVTIPTVPLPPPPPAPTVTVPPAPVRPPPKLPVDPPKPPVPVPLPETGLVPAPEGSDPEQYEQPGASAPEGGGSSSATARRSGGASSRIATISRFRTSRKFVLTTGSESARGVWITFWLSRPGTVVVLVDELAPDCRYVGKFLARGRAGQNSVRFRGRLRGRQLEAGTYRLTAHPRGRRIPPLTGVTVAIFDGSPAPAEIAAASARNTCPDGIPPSAREEGLSRSGSGSGEQRDASGGVAGVQASAPGGRAYQDESSGPFAAAAETIQSAADAIPPVLFALALLAVLLLAMAAMPQPVRASRAGAALVHHRGALALAGVGVLLAAVLSFVLLA